MLRVVNPARRKKRGTRRRRDTSGRFVAPSRKKTRRAAQRTRSRPVVRRRRSNPVGGMLMTVANPKRRRTTRRRRRTYRRNPKGALRRAVSLRGITPTMILWNTVGMIATQTLTPTVLKVVRQPTTGAIGLVGKGVTAMLGAFILQTLLKNRKAAQAFLQGGLISLATDIYNTQIKPRIGLDGYYEFTSDQVPGLLGQYYMPQPMDRRLLGVGECAPSQRYLMPTDQVVVGETAGPRVNLPVQFPARYAPAF